MSGGRRIRVLIVDDSAVVRHILTECLSQEPDIEVVGTAVDPYLARDRILELNPDVLTLDIEMPRMDGLTFLRKLMRFRPMPVLVVSSLAQASCAVARCEAHSESRPARIRWATCGIPWRPRSAPRRHLACARARAPRRRPRRPRRRVSASPWWWPSAPRPGGTEAIAQLMTALPANFPATVITQHIPAGFSKAFAERLNRTCRMEVKEAEDGDALRAGRALVAPGDFHMLLRRATAGYQVVVRDGPRVCYQRPSVDVLFASVAEQAGEACAGRDPDRDGIGRGRRDAGPAQSGRPHHRPGRSHVRGLRDAA